MEVVSVPPPSGWSGQSTGGTPPVCQLENIFHNKCKGEFGNICHNKCKGQFGVFADLMLAGQGLHAGLVTPTHQTLGEQDRGEQGIHK